jgi:hypothetical protein
MKKNLIFLLGIIGICIVSTSVIIAGVNANTLIDPNIKINTDSIQILTDNSNFKNYGFEAKEMSEPVKIDKISAIEKANESTANAYTKTAKNITAVLIRLTDNQTPDLPELGISLKDYPVWVVTFHGVILQKNFAKKDTSGNVLADENIIIDANKGNVIESFSYKSTE